ncbi:hypothetical protein ANO14919_028800 [Xylariales sp. No.14919]|nr:hypothetical protein F5X98DRAFT_354142 [Xylaria grammica]GAW13494.1 hypothetical protein ANO14919_028800 [Xylariales sp. No.14919]
MKSNIKLTVYLTTAIISEALAKRLGDIKPAGLVGIYDATFARAILEPNEMPFASEWPLCGLHAAASDSGNESADPLYCDRS